MKRGLVILLLLLICSLSFGRVKLSGRVLDAETGQPIPFAGIYFEGTTIGTLTGEDGKFRLETTSLTDSILVCQLLGYEKVVRTVKPGVPQGDIIFFTRPVRNRLSGSTVKADNKKAKALLAAIDRNRDRNNPENLQAYNCRIYSKMTLGLQNPEDILKMKVLKKNIGFVNEYMDTIVQTGRVFLPVLISETVSGRHHSLNPDRDSEDIEANRISGVNPDFNMLTPYTGDMLLNYNFYDNFINGFGVELPSPLQKSGLLYYNYYIVDSLNVSGRKTLIVHFHPKKVISTPSFDGEMQIDARDFALRKINARMKHGGNVNWIRDIIIESEFEKGPDSVWFYKKDKLYADFSIVVKDSTDLASVIGTREMIYSDVDYIPQDTLQSYSGQVKVAVDAGQKDDAYWDEARGDTLSTEDRKVYEMVDRVQQTGFYKVMYAISNTLLTGYWEVGKVSFGNIAYLASMNEFEGFRPQLGMRTSKLFSEKERYGFYAAYGTKDRIFKGNVRYEHLFSRDLFRKLTVEAQYDVLQLGKAQSDYNFNNIMSSIWGKSRRLCLESSITAKYEHEFSNDFNFTAILRPNRIYPTSFVEMVTPDGKPVSSIATNEVRLQARFSHDELVDRGHFKKDYLSSTYPIVTFDIAGSIPGLRKNDIGYFRPEFILKWKAKIPPVGVSKIKLNAGTILGRVPFPLLHMPEGNTTIFCDNTAFSNMDYMEFAMDSWVTLFWKHEFRGFFLGKIPLIRRLDLRENASVKVAWGDLREENDGTLGRVGGIHAPMLFPEGCSKMGGTPYVELSAGLANIFQLLRIDCSWRLTHLEKEVGGKIYKASRPFTVNIGVEVHF